MLLRILVSLFSLCLVVSCGGGGGSSDSSEPKDLFSVWNEQGGNEEILDLTGGELGEEMDFNVYFIGGAECDCDFTAIGTQNEGGYVINSCTYVVNSGAEDPGCNELSSTGVYSKTDDTLTVQNENATEPSTYK